MTPLFVSAQDTSTGTPRFEVPDTIREAAAQTETAGKRILSELWDAVHGLWRDRVIPIWGGMLQWTKETVWEQYMLPAGYRITDEMKRLLGREVEKRTPIIKEQLQEEKEEITEEVKTQASRAGTSIWQRFLSLFE